MRRWPIFLLVALVACAKAKSEPTAQSTALASAVNADGLAIVLCDKVASFTAPTEAARGSLVLGRGGWNITQDAELEHAELLVKDASVCAHLRFDDNRDIERLEIEAAPVGDPWADVGND